MKKTIILLFFLSVLPVWAVNFGTYKTETDYGLIDGFKWNFFNKDKDAPLVQLKSETKEEIERLEKATIGGTPKVQELLARYESTPLKSGTTLAELIKRPELDYEKLAEVDENRSELAFDVQEQVNIEIKYEGYIKRQMQQVAQFKKLEGKKLPENFDYAQVNSLRKEAVQKLNKIQPSTIGQASRISGVSPADISVLMVYLERSK